VRLTEPARAAADHVDPSIVPRDQPT